MMTEMRVQVVLTGAGIAGLWALRRLREAGVNAVLLEREAIGAGQTLGAQGILHGGVKYGLDGTDRGIAEMLRSLPPVWRECLAGNRQPDLSAAVVNSPCQHLWAAGSWLSRVGATVGSRAMQGEVRKLDTPEWPAALRDGGHRGAVYQLEETVVDVKSVLTALAAPVREHILHAPVEHWERGPDGSGLAAVHCQGVRIAADAFVFTAATGNEDAAEFLGPGRAATQRRPLRQILLRGHLPPLWGHAVTVSPKPVVTITSHPLGDGRTVWYMGGGVAEDGVSLTETAAIANARARLTELFPKLDFRGMEWACWDVDRAEPAAASRLPDGPALVECGNAALAWPAKLVYAPALAGRILTYVQTHLRADAPGTAPPWPLSVAEMGVYPWEGPRTWQRGG